VIGPRYTLAVLGALGALAMSACGGSKAKTTTTPAVTAPPSAATIEAAFIARANAVCSRALTRLNAHGPFPYPRFDPLHPDVKLLPKVGAFFSRLRPVADTVPAQLRRLGSPRHGRSAWRRLLTLARQERAIADRQIAAANASDVATFVSTVNAIGPVGGRFHRTAQAAGFAAASPCERIF
jgi:hypothetical protein